MNSVYYKNNPCKRIFILLGSILLMNPVHGSHRCYVCGPTPDPNFGDAAVRPCDRFDPNGPEFVRECPQHSRGCSLQTNGTTVTRTCESIAVDDCKIANQVKYCYCHLNLCNGDITPKSSFSQNDDEDADLEGSGSQKNDQTMTIPKLKQHKVVTTTPKVSVITNSLGNVVGVNLCLLLSVVLVFR